MKRKRTIALLSALALCFTLLTGCNQPPQESITQESGPVYTFTEFLDREGFTVGMGQYGLSAKAKSYTVNGETLWDLVDQAYGCGDTANILFARGELYGYEHSWYLDEEKGTEHGTERWRVNSGGQCCGLV